MIIDELQKQQTFVKRLYQLGFINYKLIIYPEIYLCYDRYIKLGNKNVDAIQWTADDFKLSVPSIYRIIKTMEQ